MSAVSDLQDAAFRLRNPFHQPDPAIVVDHLLANLLANWLEREAKHETWTLAEFGHRSAASEAIAVARYILGEKT